MEQWATIVILTRDSAAWIGPLLDHYGAWGVRPTLFLDSRTRDDTRAIARSRGVPIVDVAPFPYAESVVRLTRDAVKTPWAFWINDDEFPSERLLARILYGEQPPTAVQSVGIPRRWAWYEPGKQLCYGRSGHWQDRTGQNGSDHHWRLFRPDQVTFIDVMHTDGFLIDRWSRMPQDAYLVHFEWVARTRSQRAEKLRRYDRHRYGYGRFFTNLYLPEDQPPGFIEFRPFESDSYDALARVYYDARRPDSEPNPTTWGEGFAWLRHEVAHRLGWTGRLNREPRDRVGLTPRLDAEVVDPAAMPQVGTPSQAGAGPGSGWTDQASEAHLSLARSRWPGDGYMSWLAWFHATLKPATYLEVGVFRGHSLALAQPPTRAIGIDPNPTIEQRFVSETQIFTETSDAFFARKQIEERPFDLVFIDGLHLFEQTLKDFMHVEACCSRNSVILLHDTIPLDEQTQRRRRETKFYSGDVWKAVVCLKYYRPDLDIFTIATQPTGLTVVTGLDSGSHVLADNYDAAVARFMNMTYAEIANNLEGGLNIVPNDQSTVEARLKARGIRVSS